MRARLKYLAFILALYVLANLSVDETPPWDPRENRSSIVRLENFYRVRCGMTEGQVVAILGRPGDCVNLYGCGMVGITNKKWWVVDEGYLEIDFDGYGGGRVTSKEFFPVPPPRTSYLTQLLRQVGIVR
jgi:hypothetical protein